MDTLKDAVLIGLLLGDLHLQKSDSSTGKCRLRLSHERKQKDYMDWIHQFFLDWCKKTKPPYFEVNSKGYEEYLFYSEYREELIYYHNLFYKKPVKPIPRKRFVKRLPEKIDDLLTNPITLAFWFMDDGTKRTDCNAGRIATQGFSKEEQRKLKDCLWKNFFIRVELDTWHNKKGNEIYGLSIPSTGGHFEKWCHLIRPFITKEVPQMKYKLQNTKTP